MKIIDNVDIERRVREVFPAKRAFSVAADLGVRPSRPVVARVHGGPDPFLDHQFVELVHQIPAEVRTRPGDLKYLLREAVGDLLPPELLRTGKRGFVIPTAQWLRGRLRPLAKRLLSADRLRTQGIFQPDFSPRYVVPHLEGRVDYHAEVWTALMFQLWHLLYIEEGLTDAPTFSWQDLC